MSREGARMTTIRITDGAGRTLTITADTVAEVRAAIEDWRADFGETDPMPRFMVTSAPPHIIDQPDRPTLAPLPTEKIRRRLFAPEPTSKRWQGPPPRSAR